MRTRLLFATTFLLIGAGCSPESPATSAYAPNHADQVQDGEHAGQDDRLTPPAEYPGRALPAGERISLKAAPTRAGAGEIAFTLADASGRRLSPDDLSVVHEKKLHLIVVSADLRAYRHLHPAFENGAWRATTDLPRGWYRMYADFTPTAGSPEVLHAAFLVDMADDAPLRMPGQDDVTADGDASASMRAADSRFTFVVTQKGAPADLKPYLGAYGHVIILKESDADVYVHAHPTGEAAPENGELAFMGELPSSGRYTAFAQFLVGDAVRTFSFTFDR